jgi:hypothetical protein
MNANTFGKWLFGLCLLAVLLVHMWGINSSWGLIPSVIGGIGMAMIKTGDERFFNRKLLVLLGIWTVWLSIINIVFH